MVLLLQLISNGIILGCIIALGSIGLSLLYGILKFGNFAHGDMMTLGAYFAFLFKVQLGMPMWAAFVLAMALTAFVAIIVDQIIYKSLRKSDSIILLIASVGVALILRNFIQLIWGPQNHFYDKGIQMPIKLGLGVRVKPNQILILVVTVALVILAHLFLRKTKMGKAMRAMSDNMDLAKVTGINTEQVIKWTWVLGAVLTAAAGILLGIDTHLSPSMGWNLLLPLFAATILGGIGSPYGAMLGGLVIGVSQELSTLVIPPTYKPGVAFLIMLLMLLIKPTGLMGRSV